ncbi:MAG: N-acetylmuramoyl-L-alanine amidase [Alphaproteobacteria bacterium]|jgi:N-acetylmuramoyl-L-alanine amidase
MIETPSPNHEPRPTGQTIDMLVLHYTGMKSARAALDRLCDPNGSNRVSAHYLIDENGDVHRLVAESRRAWHAGVSFWRGHRNINDRSIGIELVNPGHEFGYGPFPAPQMTALIDLAQGIMDRHPVLPRNVVGHSDIAPDRKSDPGERFDWRGLAAAGVGVWPSSEATDPALIPEMLARFGYDLAATQALSAFQRRFRPHRIDGVADAECAALLGGLVRLVRLMDSPD